MNQMTAREAALRALERCRRDGAWSAMAIDQVIRSHSLDRRDAALASRLCLGVLQNSSCCDFYIDYYCSKKPEPKVRDILRLGVYQLLFMDKIPARAAVNESVTLCRAAGLQRACGLVNAVLRKIADAPDALPEIPGKGTAAYLSVRYSHPLWLVERLLREHDYPFVEAFLAANNEPPELTIQVNTLKVTAEDYKRALSRADIVFHEAEALPGCLSLAGGSIAELPGYEEGLFYVQDRAARTAVSLAGVQPGMQVLDACAAPGGKSFAAALAMEGQGEILSCDIHEKKLNLIRSGAERLGTRCIRTESRDARHFDKALEDRFDLVLADVPCSGLGVIRKRPEIRFKEEQEIRQLPIIQGEILKNLAMYVKPGGTLLYSTCTVLAEENQEVVSAFLKTHPDFSAEGFSLGGVHVPTGMYTFWPQVDGTDGFFAAKLRRIR